MKKQKKQNYEIVQTALFDVSPTVISVTYNKIGARNVKKRKGVQNASGRIEDMGAFM